MMEHITHKTDALDLKKTAGVFAESAWLGTAYYLFWYLLSSQGIAIREMLAGTALMDEATRIPQMKSNPAALLAMYWYWASDGVGSKDMVVLPYKDSLLLSSRYLQQLIMESLRKEFDLDGNRITSTPKERRQFYEKASTTWAHDSFYIQVGPAATSLARNRVLKWVLKLVSL